MMDQIMQKRSLTILILTAFEVHSFGGNIILLLFLSYLWNPGVTTPL